VSPRHPHVAGGDDPVDPVEFELVELVETAIEGGVGNVGEMPGVVFESVEDVPDTGTVGPDLGDGCLRGVDS
jgi:hypothetical protein